MLLSSNKFIPDFQEEFDVVILIYVYELILYLEPNFMKVFDFLKLINSIPLSWDSIINISLERKQIILNFH